MFVGEQHLGRKVHLVLFVLAQKGPIQRPLRRVHHSVCHLWFQGTSHGGLVPQTNCLSIALRFPFPSLKSHMVVHLMWRRARTSIHQKDMWFET